MQWLRVLVCAFMLSVGCLGIAQASWLSFSDMYSGVGSNGLILSDTLTSQEGQEVTMQGYMAPPLKPSINFFVLTEYPMAVCPFCSSDADWPENIVVVYLDEPVTALPYDSPISVTGTLSLGNEVDWDTGFVSLVRIYASQVSEL